MTMMTMMMTTAPPSGGFGNQRPHFFFFHSVPFFYLFACVLAHSLSFIVNSEREFLFSIFFFIASLVLFFFSLVLTFSSFGDFVKRVYGLFSFTSCYCLFSCFTICRRFEDYEGIEDCDSLQILTDIEVHWMNSVDYRCDSFPLWKDLWMSEWNGSDCRKTEREREKSGQKKRQC